MVLMIKDITHSYLAAHIHLDLNPAISFIKPEDLRFWEDWTGKVLVNCGNKGYEVIKGIESVAKGRIIQIVETVLDRNEVYNEMLGKMERREAESAGNTNLTDQLHHHLQSIHDVDRVSEIFCLMKMAGHPQVDVRGGGLKSKEKGKHHQPIKHEDCLGLDRSFCHVYLRGYIQNHLSWPPLQFLRREGEPPCALELLRDADFQNLPLGLSMYPATDWDNCVFLPHKSFDFGADLLSLISDKSLSYLRGEFANAWAREIGYKGPRPSTSRRVLVELLKTEYFNLESIVRTVQRRVVPWDWKIVTITPKEREMKIDPRMFAMMVLEMRTFFVALEHNIADHIFPEIGEQTMTLSKLEIVRRFFGLSNPGSLTQKVHIEIDFESWNLGWESCTVAPIGSRQDQIFGETGTFTYIHEFFEESMINVKVEGMPPDGLTNENLTCPPESELLWYGHKGGFEGINQKLWTGSTFAMIHWALWDLGIDYQLSGQGDNQVVTITVRFPNELPDTEHNSFTRKLVKDVKSRLARMCKKVGQTIKEEECIQSTAYMSYSKDMWVNGRCLSTSMKAVTRLFPTTTDECPSLSEMISGLTAGGLSVAEKSIEPLSAYWTTVALQVILLHHEMTSSLLHGDKIGEQLKYKDLRVTQKATVCTVLSAIPLEIGGFGVGSWLEFMHRGIPDPLTSALCWTKLIDKDRVIAGWRSTLLSHNSPWISQDPNIDMLILDPYSIPLNRPANPKLKAANAVKENLLDITRNRDIRGMLHSGDQVSRESILGWLPKISPFYPKVIHDLYNMSPPGVVEKFARTFTTTRTLLVLARMSGVDVQAISIAADWNMIKWVLCSLKTSIKSAVPSGPDWEPNLSYMEAESLREKWGCGELKGLTTAHAFDLGRFSSTTVKDTTEHGLVVAAVNRSELDLIRTRGSVAPYLGSSTQVKTAYKGEQLMESSPPVRDALKILGIRNWLVQPGSTLWDILTDLAQSRVAFDVDQLEPYIDPVIGGTAGHRYNMTDAQSGAYLGCHPNASSHIVLSSNLMGELGERDYPVMVQAVYLTLISLVICTWTGVGRGVYLCYIRLSSNLLRPVVDEPLTVDNTQHLSIRVNSQSPYLVGATISIPGRSTRSKDRIRARVEQGLVEQKELSIIECIRYLVRQRVRTTPRPVQLGGVSWAEETPDSIIDLPELYKITDSEFIDGVTSGVMDMIKLGRGYREDQETWETRYADVVTEMLLGFSPALLSTYNKVVPTNHRLVGPLQGISGATRLTSLCLQRWKELGANPRVIVFPSEPESIGKSVRVLFNRLITGLNIEGSQAGLKSAKALSDIMRQTSLLAVDEWDLQRRFWIAVDRVSALTRYMSRSSSHPTETLRLLRTVQDRTTNADELQELFNQESVICYIEQLIQHPGCCSPGGKPLSLDTDNVVLTWKELVSGWTARPIQYLGAGFYNWLPLRFVTRPNTKYHIIGAGDATIDPVLHPSAQRVYYDTNDSTLRRGQEMTSPPTRGKSPISKLSPLSWSETLDITNQSSLDLIVDSICSLDTVIIDVDSVPERERIQARDYISNKRPGCLVLVRISSPSIARTSSAICSCGDRTTVWWKSPVHPSYEIVAGNSSGARLCPVESLSHHSDPPLAPFPQILTPSQLDAEIHYLELSSSLSLRRARVGRRGLTRDEKRILVSEWSLTRS